MTRRIDCRHVRTDADFWAAYVQAVNGADQFGRNLDAWADALKGGPGWPGECEIELVNTEALQAWQGGRFLETLLALARSSARVKISLGKAD